MKLVELYFTDQTKPAGRRFLGAVLMLPNPDNDDVLAVRAWRTGSPPAGCCSATDNDFALLHRASRLGIYPGGDDVLFFERESDDLNGFTTAHLDRLLTESECLALGLFRRKPDASRGRTRRGRDPRTGRQGRRPAAAGPKEQARRAGRHGQADQPRKEG